jgi:hypothetical protein
MATDVRVDLLKNGSSTGDSMYWPGGLGTFHAVATWSGATVKLQFLGPDGSTWIDAGSECTLTDNGGGNFELGPAYIRAFVSGSPSGVYARVDGVTY